MPRSPLVASARAVSLIIASSAMLTAAATPPSGVRLDDARARLASGLSAATGLHDVTVAFERGGPLGWRDALLGRTVLFCASERADAHHDIWRARVRVTPGGRLLALEGVANLTTSALGDDGPLVEAPAPDGAPRRVAFVTRAFDQVQSVAVLDAAGEAPARFTTGVSNVQNTLSWRGVARWDVRLDAPVPSLAVGFDGDAVTMRAEGRAWRVDLTRGAEGVTVARRVEVEKVFVHWAVDTVRAIPWVGPVPIAWLEERVFTARDRARRLAWRWFGVRPDDGSGRAASHEGDSTQVTVAEGRALTPLAHEDGDAVWPPPELDPPLRRTLGGERNEGVWSDATPPWLRRIPGAPPAFVRTSVRLDPERPYTRVVLVAMDMRQLRLSMQAGVEDPVPLVGPRGDGHVPREPAVLGSLVAAFNGAFKTEHGEYGMVVDRRVLLPPKPRAATVATLDDGRVAMGSWGAPTTLPSPVVSLRQNLDPLLADDVENPYRRGLWGFVLGGIETMPTVRSGLCMRADGALIYVWGEETTARLLGRAMHLAGCAYGMHLDMNPGHAMFHFLRVDDLTARRWQYQAATSGMRSSGDRFIYRSPKDFFYLTLRALGPPPLVGAPWRPLPEQPPPRWNPSLLTATAGAVTLTSLDLTRITLRLRAGRREPITQGALAGRDTLTVSDDTQVLGAVELGTSSDATAPRGLAVGGAVLVPFAPREDSARFELTDAGPRIVVTRAVTVDAPDALQGIALLTAGTRVITADAGVAARVALATSDDGRLLLAEGSCTREALQGALRSAGARDALELHTGAAVAQAHWGDGVLDAYPATTLFALAREAPSPITRLEPMMPAAPPPPPRRRP